MGKVIEETIKEKDADTRVIFKKSSNSLYSYSRTCSGASQLANKSAIIQRKKKFQKGNNNYPEKGKTKRDLSIETDNCILRRFYRSKRNKMSNQANSIISKYSTMVDTEAETVDRFPDMSACGDNEIDVSACGDNEITDTKSNHSVYKTDIGTLMIENFKGLLNQWVQNHITYYNKDTQQKLDTVLGAILQKLDDPNMSHTSSDLTYVLRKEAHSQQVKNKKVATSSVTCQYCKRKSFNEKVENSISISQTDSSSPTIACYKDIRIISTLSIPRSFHKLGLDHNRDKNRSLYKCTKFKRKNVILSIRKSNKLLDCSSFDSFAMSKKSALNQCDINPNKKKHIAFCPKSYYRTAPQDYASPSKLENMSVTHFEINKDQLEEMPSLLRSVYTNEPATITTSLYKNSQYQSTNFTRHDNFTMTDIIANDILKLNMSHVTVQEKISLERNKTNIKCLNINKTTYTNTARSNFAGSSKKVSERGKICRRRKHVVGSKMFSKTKFSKSSNKKCTSYKNLNGQFPQQQEFLRCCQNVFQYFTRDDKNIKVDVRINVSPFSENETKDACTNVSNEVLGAHEVITDTVLPQNIPSIIVQSRPCLHHTIIDVECEKNATKKSSHNSPKIVPLLDGAVSQAKYIFEVNSREKQGIQSSSIVDQNTNEFEILQEISKIRAVIKDLASTAEKVVTEQFKKEKKRSFNAKSSSKCQVVINLSNASKETQVDTDFEKSGGQSASNSANRKDTSEYYNRLTKKSTSYRIIDSESIVRVTDMTSKANKINNGSGQSVEKALNDSSSKSKSLLELTTDNKLIAYFCDNNIKPEIDYSICNKCRTRSKNSKNCKNKIWSFWPKKENQNRSKVEFCYNARSLSTCLVPLENCKADSCDDDPINDPECGYCSTLSPVSTMDNEPCEAKGMGFSEGCVYCLLLWIPVLILFCIFYSLVLKEKCDNLFSIKTVYGRKMNPTLSSRDNSSVFYVKLSELGFK